MININELTNTIQTNCHISDALYAGNYSLCNFLLKMREYYRWENNIPLSQALAKSAVASWLSDREQSWEAYENLPYQHLSLASAEIDPFDAEAINLALNSEGYVYSSGYGVFGKPHFFLGKLENREQIGELTIYIANAEYARDMVAPPAMNIGNAIFVRKESLRRYLWEKIEEWRWKNNPDTAMGRALACYRIPDIESANDMENALDAMCQNEIESLILHETGEAKATHLLGVQWQQMISQVPRSALEFKLRAVKDHLADCLITLPALIETENGAALHFYFANLTGMRKEIFPEAISAYNNWVNTHQVNGLRDLYRDGQSKWLNIAKAISAAHQTSPDSIPENIDNILAQGLI